MNADVKHYYKHVLDGIHYLLVKSQKNLQGIELAMEDLAHNEGVETFITWIEEEATSLQQDMEPIPASLLVGLALLGSELIKRKDDNEVNLRSLATPKSLIEALREEGIKELVDDVLLMEE